MSELPDRLGERFALGPMIGRGSCSQVFRARDLLLDRDAAVKVFPVADHPRVQREVSLLASLDHPSLVGVYDVGQVDGRAFVVMALFEGGSLADRLKSRGPLPLGEAILGVSAVADALAHVHRSGVLHRDVTPRNVLYDADGRAHLSDFGVAFVADAPRITDTGIVVGSAPYLAPEQVLGDEVGPPADVYSLGLVMIEALSGEPPYTGTPLEAAVARLEQAPTIPPDLGDDVTTLLTEMTSTDPADRPDADAVCRRLRQAALAREDTAAARVPSPRGEFEPSRLPTRALMVVGAAAMSVLLAGTVVVASTWTVRDVSSSANPPASLSPSASTPLELPTGPTPSPHDSSGHGESPWSWWQKVTGGDRSSSRAAPSRAEAVAQRSSAPSDGPAPRRGPTEPTRPTDSTQPPSSTSVRSTTSEPTDTRDTSDTTEPSPTSTAGRSGLLPGVDLPGPTPRSTPDDTTSASSTTSSTPSRTTTSHTSTTPTTSPEETTDASTGATTSSDDTTPTTTKRSPSITADGLGTVADVLGG